MASDERFKVSYLPTGVLPIDILLKGGLPRNRATEIFGDYSTLKSYVALNAIATTQKAGGVCALIDTEHSFDPDWAESIGVDNKTLIYMTPETGEEAVDVTEVLIREEVDLIVWDSVAAMLPQAEQQKRMHKESIQPARLAALMSQALRKLTAANSKTALLFINQTRLKVGIVFGSPESVPGGKALPFYASYRLSLRKAGKITVDKVSHDGEKTVKVKETIGQKIKATVEKSKLSAPYRETWFVFDLVSGKIDDIGYLVTVGLEIGAVRNEGAMWWIDKSEIKKRGVKAFRGYLEENPTVEKSLRTRVTLGEKEVGSKKVATRKNKSLKD